MTETIDKVREFLAPTSMPADCIEELLDEAPDLWFLSDSPATLATDLTLCHPPLSPGEVRASAVESIDQGRWRLTVVAEDRAGLLADTTAVVSSRELGIVAASVATWTARSLALHALTVHGPRPTDDEMRALGETLRAMARVSAPPLVAFSARGTATVRTSGDANGRSVITVTAPDQPGLLWAICRWFTDHEANIEAAWINSADGQARDLFVVAGPIGDEALDDLAAALSGPAVALEPARSLPDRLRRLFRR